MAVIKIISLRAHNFKAHRDLSVNFGEVTQITGDNAQGKSTILEIPSWTLYGTDTMGGKLDPTPTNYSFDHVNAETLLDIDGKQVLLGRGIEKGKATYYVNEVPSKYGDFDEIVKSLFDKDLFLSLYNPSYFFTLHKDNQRDLLLRYVTPVSNKEVFSEMSRASPEQKIKDIALNPQAAKLSELVKKHTLPELERFHKKNKNDKDTAYKRAQGRTEALVDQLQKLPATLEDIEAVKAEDAALLEQIQVLEVQTDLAGETNRKRTVLESTIQSLQRQIAQAKDNYMKVYNEPIEDTCPACKRLLDTESVEAVTKDKERRKEELRAAHQKLINERKELETKRAEIEPVDISEQIARIRELERHRDQTADIIAAHNSRRGMQADIDKARADEADTLASRNDSIFVLDAIKAFEAKEAELQAAKVQGLFSTLSISLFKEQKNGERKPDFVIEKDNKPYPILSLSESVRAGLELREVLSEQSGVISPSAVDNTESTFKIKKSSSQLILVKAVEDAPLEIKQIGGDAE
ncbi:AAA family ATPase [Paenibacillus farraposensis]|uniref:Nuclease SbcCD subunit C n=1 Tax=Paenibacillus farraposensis TaxID=2807095 RepID=A0ABW4DA87_9BACL|nr:AAA family ATPase [Paenibacillus farraposensis]MCC3379867.1 AAA family ATPase [Paenibacillus farraposensis]